MQPIPAQNPVCESLTGVGANFEKSLIPTWRVPLPFLGTSGCSKTETMPAHSGHGLIFEKFEHLDVDEKVTCCKTLLICVLLNNSNKKNT